MRALVLGLILPILGSPAFADAIYSGPAGYVRLSDTPCTHGKVLVLLRDEYRPKFRQGLMMNRGARIDLCWIVDGDSVVVLTDDGATGRLPIAKFRPEVGV